MSRLLAAILVVMCVTPATVYAQQTEPVYLSVSTASAAVHRSPSTGSPVVGTARRGASLEVTRELGDWVRVMWPDSPDGFGYIHRSMGRVVRGTPTSPRTVTQVPTRPGAQPAPRSGGTPTSQRTSPQRPAPAAPRSTYVDPPTHFVGVGGLMTGSTFGYGVTGRAWSRNWLGAQVDMTRFSQTSAVTGDRVTTLQFAPSALYSFRDRVTDYVWVKPYVGGGASVRRHSFAAAVTPELSVSETKFSFQTFGGGEFTFPSVPRFAFSVDAGYDWSETPYEGYDVGGFAFSLSGRWYFK